MNISYDFYIILLYLYFLLHHYILFFIYIEKSLNIDVDMINFEIHEVINYLEIKRIYD